MRVLLGLGALEERRAFDVGLQHHLDQAFGPVRRLLGETAEPPARRDFDLAMLGRDVVGDHVEERALAAAVSADKADAGALRDPYRCLLDEQAAGDAHREVVDDQHGALYGRAGRGAQCLIPEPVAPRRGANDAVTFRGFEETDHVCSGMHGSGSRDAQPARVLQGRRAAGFAVTALSGVEAEAKTKPKEKSDASAERTERYFKAVVDLTHTMSPEFPTFFGVPGIEIRSSTTSRRTASISTGGGSSSMPARISMRRFIFPRTASRWKRSSRASSWCRSP